MKEIESIVAELVELRVRNIVKSSLGIKDDHSYNDIKRALEAKVGELLKEEIKRHEETLKAQIRSSLDEFMESHELVFTYDRGWMQFKGKPLTDQ